LSFIDLNERQLILFAIIYLHVIFLCNTKGSSATRFFLFLHEKQPQGILYKKH